jgi:uncharacterized phage-associated protein
MNSQSENNSLSYKSNKSAKVFDSNSSDSSAIADTNEKWQNQGVPIVGSKISPEVTVFDVAAYVLQKIPSCTTMKLHKLLYYCQAWSLVWDEASLFNEEIEAWANGPVIRKLFYFHQGKYSVDKSDFIIGNPNILSEKQKETVDNVIEYYGDKSAQWLIELTHLETPWLNARKNLEIGERGNNVIKNSDIAEYYSSL